MRFRGDEWIDYLVKVIELTQKHKLIWETELELVNEKFVIHTKYEDETIEIALETENKISIQLLDSTRLLVWKFEESRIVDDLFKSIMKQLDISNLREHLFKKNAILEPEIGKRAAETSLKESSVFLSKLPTTGQKLFGREQELQLLDEAWADKNTKIFSLVAWGGVGKTALVNEWLNRMERDNYRGAERVYGWSFYSQGAREDRDISADKFISKALQWFGYEGEPINSPWDKGVRLAELIRGHKTLLILDGVEPLQYPPGELHGFLKDQGLQAMLKELARDNPGLCLITTRVLIEDIEHTVGHSTQRKYLEQLSEKAGAQLLQHLGVNGTEQERAAAANEFGGHALALTLLGRYLAVVHEGEIRKRDLIPHMTEEEKHGGHARGVMLSYERWLRNTAELNILCLLCLFDRPAAGGAIEVLRAEPAIAGLTDDLQNLPEHKWRYAVQHLRDLRLLAAKDVTRPNTLDCHPLVREHFAEKLRHDNPQAWQQAHSRLYEYYKNLPEKELPDTLEEMEPLFAAVAHGCQAGRHQEAWDDVYWERIRRTEEAYTVNQLGAFGADLAALSNFFEKPWSQPVSGLTDAVKAGVLSWAGFGLRALGRLREAAQPMQASIEQFKQQKNWNQAAAASGNLSELYLTLGEVLQAVDYARQSVEFADRSDDGFQRKVKRAILADTLHQSRQITEAKNLFHESEIIQKEKEPNFTFLYSTPGFYFCNLLLSQGQYREVQKRASQTLEWVKQMNWLIDIALDNLSLGRAYLLQAIAENTSYSQAKDYLNQAVAGLREAGRQDHLPRGLLARAHLYRKQSEFAKAWADLEEAWEIAERGSMRLFMADYHLEACRVLLAESERGASGKGQKATGKAQEAREHLATAKKMIAEMGYHRRDPEVAELEKALADTFQG